MKLTTLTALLLFACTCFAQDIITLRTGTEIKAKVTEVDSPAIRYKKFENLDGPTYKLTTGEVFTIQYANGTKEFYGTAPVTTTTAPVTQNTTTAYDSLMKKAKGQKALGIALSVCGSVQAIAGGALIGLGVAQYTPPSTTQAQTNGAVNIALGSVFAVAGLVELVIGLVSLNHYEINKKAAQQIKPVAYIKPFTTTTGTSASIGMRVTF